MENGISATVYEPKEWQNSWVDRFMYSAYLYCSSINSTLNKGVKLYAHFLHSSAREIYSFLGRILIV